MKKVEAIIPQSLAEETAVELLKIDVGGITVYDSKGKGEIESSEIVSGRGTRRYRPTFNANSTLVVVVKDSMVDKVVEKIIKHTNRGKVGEGKIFISDVADAIDVGSQKHGDAAL